MRMGVSAPAPFRRSLTCSSAADVKIKDRESRDIILFVGIRGESGESGDINLFLCLRLSGPSRRPFAQVTTRQPFPLGQSTPRRQPEPDRRLVVSATKELLPIGDPSPQRPVLPPRIDCGNPRMVKPLPRADAPRGFLVGGTRNNDGRDAGHPGMLGESPDQGKGRIGIRFPDSRGYELLKLV